MNVADMPVLSIRRPWAGLIVAGFKPVENRPWNTRHRGAFLIHASQTWERDGQIRAEWIGVSRNVPALTAYSCASVDHPTGIIGGARLVDVCDVQLADPVALCDCGPWAVRGQYHWQVADAWQLPAAVPCRGRLGWWRLSPDAGIAVQVQAQVNARNVLASLGGNQ